MNDFRDDFFGGLIAITWLIFLGICSISLGVLITGNLQ